MRTRLDTFRATRRRGAVGLPEFVALALSALLLLTAILAYLFLLVPARSHTYALENERGDLERLLQSQQNNISGGKNTQQRVAEILSSLENFEVEHLGQASSGTKTVVEELNRLILKNNLRISGGVNFRQLQETTPGVEGQVPRARRPSSSGDETGQRIEQSVFPGIGVTLTVEGIYPNLRRFIGDIEADRQFVVIDTVELEGATDSNAAEAPAPVAADVVPGAAQPQTPSRNALVSLRLDMAAYFRRAAASAASQ